MSVAIYNLNGDVQVGPLVNFSVASPGTQIDADAFKPVTPFVLGPGHYSVVAYNDDNGNSGIGVGIVQSQNSFMGHISFVAGGRNAGGFTLIRRPTAIPNRYSAGTFIIVTPEPASCVTGWFRCRRAARDRPSPQDLISLDDGRHLPQLLRVLEHEVTQGHGTRIVVDSQLGQNVDVVPRLDG